MATIKDIARHAGVSVATVSYVLNDTRYVSPDKKENVLRAIRELSYVPNAVARGLRVRRSQTISLVLSDITNPFYPDLARACEEVARSKGYALNMINTNDQPGAVGLAAKQLREGKVDGMIVSTALEFDREALLDLVKMGFPVVLVHRRLDGLPIDTIVSDNEAGGYMAARHLIELGHRRIAFVTGVNGSSVNISRMAGYRRAMTEAGIRVFPEWLVSGEAKYRPSYDAAAALLRLPDGVRPTAMINLSDIGALSVLDAAADANVRVPEDLAVIGFDDLFFASARQIQLTTVRIPRYELGKLAAERLFERMNTSADTERQETVLPVEMIVRNTCGTHLRTRANL
ncbi:MAG: LacI family DNA-binding transcriptional regulator [Paenibacillaceae bacterium]|nr:LacI family DNA-binding transcriptional regulator [Paenibacillaceae bacterium]